MKRSIRDLNSRQSFSQVSTRGTLQLCEPTLRTVGIMTIISGIMALVLFFAFDSPVAENREISTTPVPVSLFFQFCLFSVGVVAGTIVGVLCFYLHSRFLGRIRYRFGQQGLSLWYQDFPRLKLHLGPTFNRCQQVERRDFLGRKMQGIALSGLTYGPPMFFRCKNPEALVHLFRNSKK